jgi:hypothetical protein
MSVKALFTLDDQLLRAAARQKASSDLAQDEKEAAAEQVLTLNATSFRDDAVVYSSLQGQSVTPYAVALPVLFWISQSLRKGMVDSLVKLNPLLMPDPVVHSYALGALSQEDALGEAANMRACLAGLSLGGNVLRNGSLGEGPSLINTAYSQFGYSCLFINQSVSGRHMALGLRTTPEAGYIFDASLGLLETPTPRDLGNLLGTWLEDSRSPWMAAHYQLWRVTL